MIWISEDWQKFAGVAALAVVFAIVILLIVRLGKDLGRALELRAFPLLTLP